MRIAIDPCVANDPGAHRWLDRILHKIEEGWHVWDTTDHTVPDELSATTWIHDSSARVQDMLVASICRAAWTLEPHRRPLRVTAKPSNRDELTPEDAAQLAEEPLWILVENRFSDGPFVERIVKELDAALRDLWNQRSDPIRIDSVGGKGQMRMEVARRTQSKPYRPRLIAVIDSDRTAPSDKPSADARGLSRKCKQHCLPCWILAKREAENYLPGILLNRRLNTGPAHRQLMEAWNRLTDDQKNFFDMKHGLPTTPSPAEHKLFRGLRPADRATLSNGFGPKVDACWALWHVPAKSELAIRGQGDLELGIDMIRSQA